jgi:large subunit ribosomal protein L2
MSTIRAKPTSPGRRFVVQTNVPYLHQGKPYQPLVEKKHKKAGRNNKGVITTRHQGGGHKKHYRVIDFKRRKDDVPATVERIEYDPNRSAHIALVLYKDGERRYILAPKRLSVGKQVWSGDNAPIRVGNCLSLARIPIGTTIHCIELKPGKGAQMIRSAGASAQLAGKGESYATIRLKSGETRRVLLACRAVVGQVSNMEHSTKSLGKAGAVRWRNIRPTVRGVAMNPIDHPHGGGEGRKPSGRHPVSPWGQLTKGNKTRKNKRSDKFIVSTRKKKK